MLLEFCVICDAWSCNACLLHFVGGFGFKDLVFIYVGVGYYFRFVLLIIVFLYLLFCLISL